MEVEERDLAHILMYFSLSEEEREGPVSSRASSISSCLRSADTAGTLCNVWGGRERLKKGMLSQRIEHC